MKKKSKNKKTPAPESGVMGGPEERENEYLNDDNNNNKICQLPPYPLHVHLHSRHRGAGRKKAGLSCAASLCMAPPHLAGPPSRQQPQTMSPSPR